MFAAIWNWLKMVARTLSFHWLPNPGTGGDLDGHNPLGDKQPVPRTVQWGDMSALISAISQRTIGTPFAQNVRQYLTGTGASAALITVDDSSWTITAGDSLTNPGTDVGAGSLKLTASIDGSTAVSGSIPWQWTNPPIIVPPPASNAVRWRPTIFIHTGVDPGSNTGIPSSQYAEVKAFPKAAGMNFGIGMTYMWRALQDNAGALTVTQLLRDLDNLRAQGLYAFLYVSDNTFSGSTNYCPSFVPVYQKANSGSTTGGIAPKIWTTQGRDQTIDFWQKLGAAINGHPALECITWRELSPGFGTSEFAAAGFDTDAYIAAIESWAVATKAAFPNVNIGAPGNFCVQQSRAESYVKFMFDHGVGIGGPDLYPQDPYRNGGSSKSETWTDSVIRGKRWNGSSFVSGATDYRGKIYCNNTIQGPEQGRGYTWPPQGFFDYITHPDGLPQSHMVIYRKDWPFTNMAENLQTYWSRADYQPDANLRFKSWLSAQARALPLTPPTFYNGNVNTAA